MCLKTANVYYKRIDNTELKLAELRTVEKSTLPQALFYNSSLSEELEVLTVENLQNEVCFHPSRRHLGEFLPNQTTKTF